MWSAVGVSLVVPCVSVPEITMLRSFSSLQLLRHISSKGEPCSVAAAKLHLSWIHSRMVRVGVSAAEVTF